MVERTPRIGIKGERGAASRPARPGRAACAARCVSVRQPALGRRCAPDEERAGGWRRIAVRLELCSKAPSQAPVPVTDAQCELELPARSPPSIRRSGRGSAQAILRSTPRPRSGPKEEDFRPAAPASRPAPAGSARPGGNVDHVGDGTDSSATRADSAERPTTTGTGTLVRVAPRLVGGPSPRRRDHAGPGQ